MSRPITPEESAELGAVWRQLMIHSGRAALVRRQRGEMWARLRADGVSPTALARASHVSNGAVTQYFKGQTPG